MFRMPSVKLSYLDYYAIAPFSQVVSSCLISYLRSNTLITVKTSRAPLGAFPIDGDVMFLYDRPVSAKADITSQKTLRRV